MALILQGENCVVLVAFFTTHCSTTSTFSSVQQESLHHINADTHIHVLQS